MPASDSPRRRENNPVRQIWRDVEEQVAFTNGYWEFYLTIHLNYPQEDVDAFLAERNLRRRGGE